jgi:hypothetical protein
MPLPTNEVLETDVFLPANTFNVGIQKRKLEFDMPTYQG